MLKEDVIKRFCALATAVGMTVFEDKEAHDCFCGENNQFDGRYFQFSETVLEWIEAAIKDAIGQHNNGITGVMPQLFQGSCWWGDLE
jgi:hypothetical protein